MAANINISAAQAQAASASNAQVAEWLTGANALTEETARQLTTAATIDGLPAPVVEELVTDLSTFLTTRWVLRQEALRRGLPCAALVLPH